MPYDEPHTDIVERCIREFTRSSVRQPSGYCISKRHTTNLNRSNFSSMSTVLQAPKSGNATSASKTADGTIFTVDDFIRQLATDQEQVPLLAYPVIEQGVSKCERFTGQDLDRFADAAAKYFITSGLGPVVRIMGDCSIFSPIMLPNYYASRLLQDWLYA